jgi:hypothetical protein
MEEMRRVRRRMGEVTSARGKKSLKKEENRLQTPNN